MIDKDVFASLYMQGLKLREIGEIFDVSTQRVNQIARTLDLKREKPPTSCWFDKKTKRYVVREYTGIGKWGYVGGYIGKFKTFEEAKKAHGTYRAEKLKQHPNSFNRIYVKKNPSKSECWVANKLKLLGLKVEFTPHKNPYDLMVNNKIRIEVKHRPTAQEIKGIYKLNLFSVKSFDFLIAVFGELKDNPAVYIIPSTACTPFISLKSHYVNKCKYAKYLTNWQPLTA